MGLIARAGAGICAGDGVLATAHYLSKEISWIDMNTLQTTRSSVSTGNPTCIASYVSSNETSGAGGIVMTARYERSCLYMGREARSERYASYVCEYYVNILYRWMRA